MRYAAVRQGSYTWAVVSSVGLGLGFSVILVGFTQVPRDWFPSETERSAATAVAVQTAFFGWACGGFLTPLCVASPAGLALFSFWKAVVVSLCLAFFLMCHRAPPLPLSTLQSGGVASGGEQARLVPAGLGESVRLLACNWRYLAQSFACALFTGVGWTVPAIVFEVMEDLGYGPRFLARANTGFITGGVVLGLILGRVVPQASSPELVRSRVVLVLFWGGAVAVWLLQLASSSIGSGGLFQHFLVMAVMVLSGSCLLGSVNTTLLLVCETAMPVSESQSGGVTELLTVLMTAGITQLGTGYGFWLCAWASLLAALLMSATLCVRATTCESSPPASCQLPSNEKTTNYQAAGYAHDPDKSQQSDFGTHAK